MSDERLIFDTARRTLAIEADALTELRDSLDERFARVVQRLRGCGGRVVVTGVGKSALVAQKITATFNSTGTPALFMHAADAIHGDLGMIQAGDVVLALSKSGETAEMRALLPLVRQRGNAVVAMVANAESFLALQSDELLLTPVAREADPHNLAPTASALTQMAMGDALATALAALRGFGPGDFARLHPGGSLGKRLTLTLADVACRNACPQVLPEATLQDVVLEITNKRLGATAVVGAAGELRGLITDGDLRRALTRGMEALRLSAKQLMTPNPRTLPAAALAAEGLALCERHDINHVLVTDRDGAYAGMAHLHDFVREGLG